jgi:uncharacterized protein YjbI with pentapeptide repeats
MTAEYPEMVTLLKETIEDWNQVLEGVNLHYAKLSGANLIEAKNLIVGQLCETRLLYESKLDSALKKQAEGKCSRLLEL